MFCPWQFLHWRGCQWVSMSTPSDMAKSDLGVLDSEGFWICPSFDPILDFGKLLGRCLDFADTRKAISVASLSFLQAWMSLSKIGTSHRQAMRSSVENKHGSSSIQSRLSHTLGRHHCHLRLNHWSDIGHWKAIIKLTGVVSIE